MSNSLKARSDIAAVWVGIVSAIIGGYIALYGYIHDISTRLTDRQKESIKFSETFDSDHMFYLRKILFDAKAQAYKSLNSDAKPVYNLGNVQKTEDKFMGGVMNYIVVQGKGPEMRELVAFFDRAYACIQIGACDRAVATSLLHEDAYEISYDLKALIAELRQTNPNFGKGLQAIVEGVQPRQ